VASGRRELDRVREQVPDDLLQTRGVGEDIPDVADWSWPG